MVKLSFHSLVTVYFDGLQCNVEKPAKNPGRWRKAYLFRQVESAETGESVKEILLQKCNERKDKWGGEVRLRIQGAESDLHAADARYHADCRSKFIGKRNANAATSTSIPSRDSDTAFDNIVKCMEFDMSKIWNSIELFKMYEDNGADRLQRKQLVNR